MCDRVEPHSGAPDWFRHALEVPFTTGTVPVGEASINYLAWGEPGRPGLLFVHGGGAHAHWWTHVAATFAHEYRVLALDLSGHGDSDYRSTYTVEQWAGEVVAVADAGEMDGAPLVVGHSVGGIVSVVTAALHGDRISGVILCDSPITEPDPIEDSQRVRTAFGAGRTYGTFEEALQQFRVVPPQPNYLDYVVDHIARRSIRQVAGGWQLKFDRRIFEQFSGGMRGLALPYLPRANCRLAMLRSECGLVTPEIAASMVAARGRAMPVIEIPIAAHHLMLDQPLLLLVALRTLLAEWAKSGVYDSGSRGA